MQITGIEQKLVNGYVEVRVNATVLDIKRSAQSLKKGDTIKVLYDRWAPSKGDVDGLGWPETPIIESKYLMYLKKLKPIRSYEPTSGRESFYLQ